MSTIDDLKATVQSLTDQLTQYRAHIPQLSEGERLIWLLGDLMNAAENYFGAQNPKREGHIHCAFVRIDDDILIPLHAEIGRLRAQNAEYGAALDSTRLEVDRLRARNAELQQTTLEQASEAILKRRDELPNDHKNRIGLELAAHIVRMLYQSQEP